MRKVNSLILALSVGFLLFGCTSIPPLHYTTTAEGGVSDELAWILTPGTTIVNQVDGEEIPSDLKAFYNELAGSWIAVTPGKHRLTVSYTTATYWSAAPSEIVIESFAGKTNYVFGRVGGGIRYYQLLIDRPADEALMQEMHGKVHERMTLSF